MSNFEEEFVDNYLKFGLGSMPKADIDALVMHLLDKYGYLGSPPLAIYNNQTVSERLKTPVNKVKKLRYDAALKFGERIEDEARGRLLAALANASLEPDGDKVRLIIEDALAKNWLQGQLKSRRQIFDHSFNTEIVKVSAEGLFDVLEAVFGEADIAAFRDGYEKLLRKEGAAARARAFRSLIKKFTEGAASAAGKGVVATFRAHLGA